MKPWQLMLVAVALYLLWDQVETANRPPGYGPDGQWYAGDLSKW